jgi:hypothetical protein
MAKDSFVHHFGSRTYTGNRMDLNALLRANWEKFKRKWGLPAHIDAAAGYNANEPVTAARDVRRFYVPLPEAA